MLQTPELRSDSQQQQLGVFLSSSQQLSVSADFTLL